MTRPRAGRKVDSDMKHLTDAELEAAKYNFEQAKASLACEGMYFTEKEEALFHGFIAARLPHDERRRRIVEFCRAKQGQQ
jgi:hypothetical protein